MSWEFVFAIILFIIAGFCLLGVFFSSGSNRKGWGAGTAVVTALALVLTFLACFQQVGTKDIGVLRAFGSTEGHIGPGLHLEAPWETVTTMDAAIQTDTYSEAKNNAFTIRIANQQTAYPAVTVRWRIRADSADYLFQNYRTFENVRESLVTKELQTTLSEVLSNYNALNSVQYGTPANGAHNPSYPELAHRVLVGLQGHIGKNIDVLSVFMPLVGFDKDTEQKLNQLQLQIAKTRIADQTIITNEKLNTANKKLSASISHDPNILVAQCMNSLQELVNQNQTIPPGFSCWPGGGVAGIIANTK